MQPRGVLVQSSAIVFIHLFIFRNSYILVRVSVDLEHIMEILGLKWEYTLDLDGIPVG